MNVSERDQATMRNVVRRLEQIETNELPEPSIRAMRVADANRFRELHGIAPLEDEADNPPELEFYRRARALGFRRSRG